MLVDTLSPTGRRHRLAARGTQAALWMVADQGERCGGWDQDCRAGMLVLKTVVCVPWDLLASPVNLGSECRVSNGPGQTWAPGWSLRAGHGILPGCRHDAVFLGTLINEVLVTACLVPHCSVGQSIDSVTEAACSGEQTGGWSGNRPCGYKEWSWWFTSPKYG